MTSIGIVSGNEALRTANILSQLYEQAHRQVSIHGLSSGESVQMFNVLIVNEENKDLPHYIACLSPGGILIANGDNIGILPYLKGVRTRLITYGYSQKACVTASSITPEEIQCCIQRLLPTFSGKVLEPQEFPVVIQDCHKNIYNILGALTAALLDDVYCP